MWVELPMLPTVLLNAIGLPALQLALAWLFNGLPAGWFEQPISVRQTKVPGIRRNRWWWKRRLPDGAAWFAGGFPKARLIAADPAYLARFIAETRRGELCHWTFLALTPLFFVWNPPWACGVIVIYAMVANVPCILLQRINRRRLASVWERRRLR